MKAHSRRVEQSPIRDNRHVTPQPSGTNPEELARTIVELRGQRVILDRDLAGLYGVTTKRFNEAVKRNAARFPEDFMFRLSAEETAVLRSQIATSKPPDKDGRGGPRYRPLAFTEHGAIQAANVLNSPRAIEMGVHVVRAFIRRLYRHLLRCPSAKLP